MNKIKTEDMVEIGTALDVLITAISGIGPIETMKDLHTLYLIAGDCKAIHTYLKWLKVAFPKENLPHLDENLDKIRTLISKVSEVENSFPVA